MEVQISPHKERYHHSEFPNNNEKKERKKENVVIDSKLWLLTDTKKKLYEIDNNPLRHVFLNSYFYFMDNSDMILEKIPVVAKYPLDLYKLYVSVKHHGGYKEIVKKRKWSKVVRDLNLPSTITSAAYTLKTQYSKLLYPFEQFMDNKQVFSKREDSCKNLTNQTAKKPRIFDIQSVIYEKTPKTREESKEADIFRSSPPVITSSPAITSSCYLRQSSYLLAGPHKRKHKNWFDYSLAHVECEYKRRRLSSLPIESANKTQNTTTTHETINTYKYYPRYEVTNNSSQTRGKTTLKDFSAESIMAGKPFLEKRDETIEVNKNFSLVVKERTNSHIDLKIFAFGKCYEGKVLSLKQ